MERYEPVCPVRARHDNVQTSGVAAQVRVIEQVPEAVGAHGLNKISLHKLSVSSSTLYALTQCSLVLPPPFH